MFKTTINFLHILFIIIISLNAPAVFASVVTLAWDAPTTNADGTPLTDLAGYKIYYGTSLHTYSTAIDVGNVTEHIISNLENGVECYFAVTAYDTSGNESNFSNEVRGIGINVANLSPNGGEVIPSGSIYTISWNAPPEAEKFTLEYSKNNGQTWILIKDNVTGTSYNWTVPTPLKNRKNCLVKVIGYDASNVEVSEDTSDGTFTIEVIKVTSPNGQELWKAGTTHDITWTTNGTTRPVKKVKLFYTYNGGTNWILIYTILWDNPGSYRWRVPVVSSSNCKVKVVLKDELGNTIGTDVSDNNFIIQPAP